MESRAHALMAGLFTLVFAAALGLGALWLGGRGRAARESYILVSRSSISGLNPQAPVKYRGVEVGRVDDLDFDPRDPRSVLITVSIDPRTHVTSATYGRLGYQGVTGLAFVDLDDDGQDGAALDRSQGPPRLEMRPSALQEFGDAGQTIMVRANEIAERLGYLLNEENRVRASHTLDNIERATARFVRVQDRLLVTLDGLPGVTQRADTLLEHGDKLVSDLEELSRDARHRLVEMERVGHAAEGVGRVAEDVSTRTLPELDRLVRRLSRSAENLDRVLEEQAEQPQRLLFGAQPAEPGPGEPGFGSNARQRKR